MKNDINRQKGVGLLELMLVLLIIAVVLFMATRYYQTTRLNSRVTKAATMINTVVEASYAWLKGVPNFQGDPTQNPPIPPITTSVLVNSGLLAKSYEETNANPWGGDIEVSPWGADNQHVTITLKGVSLKACKQLELRLRPKAYQNQISTCAGTPTDFWVVF